MLKHGAKLLIFNNPFKNSFHMSYLHIAEKNSIAKEVANILSDGTKRTGFTRSTFNPVYEFTIDQQLQRFTSVRGHLFDFELPEECKSWANYDNGKILTRDVRIVKKPGKDMENIFQNIEQLAKKSKHLVLWLDCDRQGQSIAFQVIELCKKANPNLTIKRARFSAVTKPDILRAYHNLVDPNQRQADAVFYRQEIDLRLGCTFTRFQTVVLRQKFSDRDFSGVISYGPCQLPTLGFVVERYLQIKYFQPENYYFLKATCVIDENTGIDLKWTKQNARSKTAIAIIFNNMYKNTGGEMRGKVTKRSKNVKKRYRPYPLTTVELQKLATDKLRMSSARVMQIAENLYTRGFISYPRTQTNSFPKTMNLRSLIDRLRPNQEYKNYIEKLLDQNKFQNPKVGNSDDQAHSPIHPVKNVERDSLNSDEWKVYNLVSRHFLACCSQDAIGDELQILADIGGETFKAAYLTIREKNFLEIYPFVKWSNSALEADIPEQFQAFVELCQQKTKPPAYLSESNLIEAMEKNNIGTDSTIHQHIQNIQKRNYAIKNNNTFKPTSLGVSLIVAYRNLGMKIADCDVRRMMEQNMEKIAQGIISKDAAVLDTLSFMVPIYEQLSRTKATWLEQISKAMQEHSNLTSILELQTNQNSNSRSNVSNQNNNTNSNTNQGRSNQIVCYKCNQPGHFATQCSKPHQARSQSAQPVQRQQNNLPSSNTFSNNNYINNVTCYRCNEKGHFAPNCPNIGLNGKPKKGNTKSQNKNTYNSGSHHNNSNQTGFSRNQSSSNSHETNTKRPRKPKVCQSCGVQGRHPKNSTCPTLKKNKSEIDFL